MMRSVLVVDDVIFISWWCKCSLSGLPIDSPFNSLLIIAHVVSKMGINNKRIGIMNEDNVTFLNPNKDISEII